MNRTEQKLILASGSPRRRELLAKIAKNFEVIPSDAPESLRADLSPEENAEALALDKARAVALKFPGRFVLGADTIVILEGEILGKPRDAADAARILRTLSGKTHRVATGIAAIRPNGEHCSAVEISEVTIKVLADAEIEEYIATGEPMDKAGAYAIQGRGAALVESHNGSWSNVVGLPLERVETLLTKVGFAPK